MSIALTMAPAAASRSAAARRSLAGSNAPKRAAVSARPARSTRASAPRPRSSAPAALQLTTRGRLAIVLMVVLAAFALMLAFGARAQATDAAQGPATAVVVVQAGESLWSIAQVIAPDADPRATVNAIKDLNGMSAAVVAAGQSLVVPITR
ncbi:MAG: LysM peptidoglycan-binding domain-containing protein [Candidatus Nanopelagicales bacterium]|nr:LysM peptidoglycan-binding domain-containing protein [Candidatus Nanopelagicales bacterium]